MDTRQAQLLNFIVDQYTKTAQPVGSKLIAEMGRFDLSPATIRNEMVLLETAGYIFQPYTSAGRIPSEKGYRFYVDNFIEETDLPAKAKLLLVTLTKPFPKGQPELLKSLAKGLAELSTEAVFVGFSAQDIYYTGLANLFGQPEFSEQQLVFRLSQVIDHLDQVITDIFDQVDEEVSVLIGSRNPFGRDCTLVLAKYQIKDSQHLVGIIGPMRMDYQQNISLLKFSQRFINQL